MDDAALPGSPGDSFDNLDNTRYIPAMSMKNTLLALLKKQLEARLEQVERDRTEAQEESNRHIGRMESRYDTFKEESQYLADGFSREAATLRAALETISIHASAQEEHLDTIDIGSSFMLSNDVGGKSFFLFTVGGGVRISSHGNEYYVITPESTLGQSVFGKKMGDAVSVTLNGKEIRHTIFEIQ